MHRISKKSTPESTHTAPKHNETITIQQNTQCGEQTHTERSVHGVAHDSGQEGTTAADQSTHHGQQGLVQDEALSTQRPACV